MSYRIRYIFSFILVITIAFGGMAYNMPKVQADQALQNAQANRAALEAELATLEQEIAQKQQELAAQKGQSVSLSRDIAILTTQIKKLKLDIQAKTLLIKELGGEIIDKNQQIETLTNKIETEKESLAQLIRKDREIDNQSIIFLILSQDNISSAYGDISAFASIKESIRNSVNEISSVKSDTETEKQTLQQQQNQQTDLQYQLEQAQKQIQANEDQQKQLLAVSNSKVQDYQQVLADKAARRAEILAVLFNLRDASAIPFGTALAYANTAQKITGVDPAFLLAIITQESNLGSNVGSCYVTDMSTGAGVNSKTGTTYRNVMKPSRDIGSFKDITLALGRDPANTLVSCPIASAGSSSWGGAMGPAQFIPSTWQGMASNVANALGITTPDPWNPRDAFMASALFLKDLGGTGNSYTAQIRAACKYYGSGGSSCSYGKQVMAKASNIQTTMIDPLHN